jgi:mannose-6-phosphate isomerase
MKQDIINEVKKLIDSLGFEVVDTDFTKPWGAFFRLDNKHAEAFIDKYYADIKDSFETFEGLSPKYLIVQPGERLSWQYHHRRAEHWRVLQGTVGVKLSNDDTEPAETVKLKEGELIQFPELKRHRLIGLDDWGLVVEIWQHTDPNSPSDEADIVRVADDYNR